MSAVCRRMTLADVPQVHAIEERTFATPWSYQSFVELLRFIGLFIKVKPELVFLQCF